MGDDLKFGPDAQTPAQRAYVLQQAKAANPGIVRNATPYTHQLYGRYVAGELSWAQVCELRDAHKAVPGIDTPA
ncbi:hypothetical protein D0T11_21435 [Hymenobacter rubripertinctus]|uniref:Antitoxin VbhA domain-containing protein n=1 Tax=Hymenobacter rubripertinctus TaxID=2029981 RepID=A0A418QI17_9BACT|nr:hypothetical protein D0T11_21435 [Hymenobacter rubripertinctus]